MNYYTSDSHLLHTNILRYSRRPFQTIQQMDLYCLEQLRAIEAEGHTVIHGGDLTFNIVRVLAAYGQLFSDPARHVIVLGNHDNTKRPSYRAAYGQQFGHVIGSERTWRDNVLVVDDVLDGRPVKVLVSHFQQRDLQGCDINVHGHIHNNLFAPAESRSKNHLEDEAWTLESPVHFNCGVDLHRYRPVPLQTLADAHRRKYDGGVGNRL